MRNRVFPVCRGPLLALALISAAVIAPGSAAQTTYGAFSGTVFGGPAHYRTLPLREQLKVEGECAGYHLGPIRLLPVVALREVGYNNNVFGTADNPLPDWTGTLVAGTRYLLPLGSKFYLRGNILPEYTWYAKYDYLSHFGGDYSAALIGLFNRLTFSVSGETWSGSQPVSSEIQQPAIYRIDTGKAELDVDILRRLSLVGGVGAVRTKYTDVGSETSGLADLDRTDSAARLGLRYRFEEYFSVAALVERTQSEFVTDFTSRDNETTAYLLSVRYDQKLFYLTLTGGYREGRPYNGSTFPSYDEPTGSAFLSYFVSRRVELQWWLDRAPVNSLFADNPYYIETRTGGAVNLLLGQRTKLRGWVDVGSNRYPLPQPAQGGGVFTRSDDFLNWGGGLSFKIERSLWLTVGASEWRLTSNIPGYGYSMFRLTTGLTFEPTPKDCR